VKTEKGEETVKGEEAPVVFFFFLVVGLQLGFLHYGYFVSFREYSGFVFLSM